MTDYKKALFYVGKANDAFRTCGTVVNNAKKARDWWDGKHKYTVSVSAKDSTLHMYVLDWLTEITPRNVQRSLQLTYSSSTERYTARSDESASHVIELNGVKVKVEILVPPSLSEMLADDSGITIGKKHDREILFTVSTREAQDMILKELQDLWVRMRILPRQRYLWTLNHNGTWSTAGYIPKRELASVVLPDGQVDRIVDDMEKFHANQESYHKLGLPYHRGYMFYGPPGTGKTSLAKALAQRFDKDLYYLPIAAMKSDISLMNSFRSMGEGSFLLLEDIDVFLAMQNRNDAKRDGESFSLSGLLNVLDGVMTPEGLTVILTTNDIDKIDPAILRPGRVDVMEKLDNLVAGQAEDIFFSFYGRYPSQPLNAEGRSPSEIINHLKQHMHDPEMAERAILKKESVES